MIKKVVLAISCTLISTQALADVQTGAGIAATASKEAAAKEASVKAQQEAASAATPVAASTAGAAAATTTPAAPPAPTRPARAVYTGFGFSMQNVKGYTGLMPKVFLGYAALLGECKTSYLAAEVWGGGGSIPLSRNQHFRVAEFLGASVMPGFLYNTTILFARMGVQYARYSKKHETRGGAMAGVGFQPNISQRWDVRFEYDFTIKGSLNQFNVDFVYRFC